MDDDLSRLGEKIKQAQHHEQVPKNARHAGKESEGSQAGIQAGFELVGSIGICTALGYGLDHWLGTKPFLMLLLFFIGVFVGFFNVYRVSQNLGSAVGYSELHKQQKEAKTAPDDKDSDIKDGE